MVNYLKKIALRGTGVVKSIRPPFKYNSISFSQGTIQSDETSQDISIGDSTAPKSRKSSDINTKISDKSSQEQREHVERITTYEIPLFKGDRRELKNLTQENTISNRQQETKSGNYYKQKINSAHPVHFHSTLQSPKNMMEKDKDENIVNKDDVKQHLKEMQSNGKRVEDKSISYIGSPKKKENTTPLKHDVNDKETGNAIQKKPKTHKPSAKLTKTAVEGKVHRPNLRNGEQKIVEIDQQHKLGETKRNNSPEVNTVFPIAVALEPIPKEDSFTSSDITSRSMERVSISQARFKPRPSEVNVSVGKLEVCVEKPQKVIVSPQKSEDGFEKYWLQRNYFRII